MDIIRFRLLHDIEKLNSVFNFVISVIFFFNFQRSSLKKCSMNVHFEDKNGNNILFKQIIL